MSTPTDITIIGLGILGIQQVTRETERALDRSNEVLFVDTGIATRAFLEQHCPRITDLYAESYRVRGARLNAYHHMAARTVDAALDHGPVAFAMTGHPLVYAYAPPLIIDMARLLGLTVQVLPGISALDCLFAELVLDPCTHGLQMYEATDLLLRRRPLQPDVPTLIWQVGNLETRLHTDRMSQPERFERFREHLLRFYPPQHLVTAYFAAPIPLMPSTVLRFPLLEITDHAATLHPGVTLYLPPVSTRPIEDAELLDQIDSPEHLDRITR
ncbi:MAG: hypothetical protein JRI25_07210 [Deltaproteobacteria bacterium]|nr:hypothetical protein [Deltaproteobacteria bacterium]MBW2254369.1 hypothetical protein [Deltaproteobacteria bacterium]